MAIQTKRHFDDPEDAVRTFFVVMDKSNGHVYGIYGAPNCLLAAETQLDDLLYTGSPDSKPADLANRDLAVIEVDAELGMEMIDNGIHRVPGTNRPVDMRAVFGSCKCRAEYKKSTQPEATNKKGKEGIPPGHLKKTMVAKYQGRRPTGKGKPAVVIQNLYKARSRRVDPEIPNEDVVERLLTEDADRIEIVVSGRFDVEQDGRWIYIIRYDGKQVGRYKVRQNALSFTATFFDHARGDHLYQMQIESPLDGDEIIEPTIVIEEDDKIVKFKKKDPDPEEL